MINELNVLRDFLKKRHLNVTKQREEILRVFLQTDRHFTVEDLYRIVKKKDPAIGQATVFRTLKLFCEANIANEVNFGDKKIRYEHKYGHQHHDHLVCVKCGRFIEVVEPKIERLQEALCRRHEFLPEKHKMEVFGICKRCRGRHKGNV